MFLGVWCVVVFSRFVVVVMVVVGWVICVEILCVCVVYFGVRIDCSFLSNDLWVMFVKCLVELILSCWMVLV